MDTSGNSEEHSIKMEEAVYDCVICNQSTPSTQDKPMGLVTLLQSTSGMVLVKFRHVGALIFLNV